MNFIKASAALAPATQPATDSDTRPGAVSGAGDDGGRFSGAQTTPGPQTTASSQKGLQQASLLNSYGIGAKLMLQMGYTPGTALGDGGLVAPLETKAMPANVGIGATTAPTRAKTVNNSLTEVYELMEQLSLEGVEIPHSVAASSGQLAAKLRKLYEKITIIGSTEKSLLLANKELRKQVQEYEKTMAVLEGVLSGSADVPGDNIHTRRLLYAKLQNTIVEAIQAGNVAELEAIRAQFKGGEDYFEEMMIYETKRAVKDGKVLKMFISSDIIADKDRFMTEVLTSMKLGDAIDSQFRSLATSPLYLLEYVSLAPECQIFQPLIKQIFDRYLEVLSVEMDYHEVQETVCRIWMEVFKQYLGAGARNSFRLALFERILKSPAELHAKLVLVATHVFDDVDFEVFASFKVFNPIFVALEGQERMAQLVRFRQIYAQFLALIEKYPIPKLVSIASWYVDEFFSATREWPTLKLVELPGDEAILAFIRNAQPQASAHASFKDVVEQFCVENNIVVRPTAEASVYEFERFHRVKIRLKEDVLWLNGVPIGLSQLKNFV